MSVMHASTEQPPQNDAAVEELLGAIKDLPVASQDEVTRELVRAAVEYRDRGRVDPLLHFVNSLFATARLHRNQRYVKALATTDAEEANGNGGADVVELLARYGFTRQDG